MPILVIEEIRINVEDDTAADEVIADMIKALDQVAPGQNVNFDFHIEDDEDEEDDREWTFVEF